MKIIEDIIKNDELSEILIKYEVIVQNCL
jgi:hypothetical protein